MGQHRATAELEMVEAVRGLGPAVEAAADWIDRERRLPDNLVAAIRAAGVFEMYLPRFAGGAEVHPLTAFVVAEELARHDGSVGWCAQVAAAVTTFLAWIDPVELLTMRETCGWLHLAGSARPLGTARRVEGGLVAEGHWDYASGVRHANWFLATCLVERSDGAVTGRSMILPVTDGRIVANWDVVGMRGTGSDDFVVDGVLVPEGRIASRRWITGRAEPLYDPRLNMVAAWAPTAGVGIGLAQGAIDALVALGVRRSTGSPVPLREREAVQDAVARAEAITGAARAFVAETLAGAWDALPAGGQTLTRAVTRAQLAITHAMNEAVRAVDVAFHAAGTNAISTANRLERSLRDVHTAVQHAAGMTVHQRPAGRVLLGLDPGPVDPIREGPTTPRP
jgi:indole-3-acetate monooxygenase